VIEDYSEFKTDRVVKVAKTYRVEFSSEATKEEICKAFADEIRQRLAKANLPTRLKDLSISIEQLSLAVEDASRLDYINTLPRSMSSDDLFKLIKMAY
jgi:alcohol dehydrogenase